MEILDNGIQLDNGRFRYLWFRVRDDFNKVHFRAVTFRELAVIALDRGELEDYNVYGKHVEALRGLYNAEVDFVYTATGIFKPDHVGVVQFFGAAGESDNLAEAAAKAEQHQFAVLATLANMQQSQMRVPNIRWIEWYLDFVSRRARNVAALLGHPDPRERRSPVPTENNQLLPLSIGDDLLAEQNELLFRGLAKLREDFIFQVTAERLRRDMLTKAAMRVAAETSNVASRQRGSISIGANLSIPIMAALSNNLSAGHTRGKTHSRSVTDGQQHNWGEGLTESQAHTESFSHTRGKSKSQGLAISHTSGRTVTISEAETQGQAHTESIARTNSRSVTNSRGSFSGWSSGGSYTQSGSQTDTQGSAVSESDSQGWNNSLGGSVGAQGNIGIPGVAGGGVNGSINASVGQSGNHTNQSSLSNAHSESSGWAATSNWGASGGSSQSTSVTTGSSTTRGQSDTVSRSQTKGRSEATMEADTITRSWQWGENESFTSGRANTIGQARSKQEGWGESHQEGISQGVNQGRTAMQGISRGLSTGMIPGLSLNRSWMTEDHVAQALTNIYSRVKDLLIEAGRSGGYLTEAVLFTESDAGASAGDALVPQAFHGPKSITPVLTVRPTDRAVDHILRSHALAFSPYLLPDPNDPLHGALGGKFSTILTIEQLAAYTAPAIFREGTTKVIPAIPKNGLGFYPDMEGDILLGHQYSPETGDLTKAPVKLKKGSFVHMMFTSATGYGKSVGAMRLVYEVARHWDDYRVVVLDFGYAWRQLYNAPGLQGKVDIRQLTPTGVRPLRWNPLQISRYIHPEEQMKAFASIFSTVAQLGVKQQQHRFLDAVEAVYIRSGVLVDDPKVRADTHWGKVVDQAEAAFAGANVGDRLGDLTPDQRQLIAIHRSKSVGLRDLNDEIVSRKDALPTRDQIGRGIYEGIEQRLMSLLRGSAEPQFAAGFATIDVGEMGEEGVLILEGGQFLGKFEKAWLLGWAGWLIVNDKVKKRERQMVKGNKKLLLVFEEANKILTGMDAYDPNNPGGGSVSEYYEDMARDTRKYGVNLVFITQSPAAIPVGIRSSCSSLVIGFLGEPEDKDVVLSALGKSEKGFRDEDWRRLLSDLQIGMNIGRFPYSFERAQMRPVLFMPLMLQAEEPSDAQLAAELGRIELPLAV